MALALMAHHVDRAVGNDTSSAEQQPGTEPTWIMPRKAESFRLFASGRVLTESYGTSSMYGVEQSPDKLTNMLRRSLGSSRGSPKLRRTKLLT